jgi:hypothetical protein
MSPLAEQHYLSVVPTKRILYNDILSFQTLSVGAGANVSQILTNGVSRPRYLLVVPQLAGTINGSTTLNTYTAGVVPSSPMSSPFSSSPATCCPQASVTNFNVLVSGSNIYQNSFQYTFEHWRAEVRQSNSLNGGVATALSSGLLSQTEWENGYRAIYVDLSRHVSQANDDISRSIQVVFTNSSGAVLDFIYIIGYERELQISTSTGALIV